MYVWSRHWLALDQITKCLNIILNKQTKEVRILLQIFLGPIVQKEVREDVPEIKSWKVLNKRSRHWLALDQMTKCLNIILNKQTNKNRKYNTNPNVFGPHCAERSKRGRARDQILKSAQQAVTTLISTQTTF